MGECDTYMDEEFIIMLTVDGTEYEDVEVVISDPCKTIRNQITSIISVFELPRIDNGGNPIQYLLGQIMDEDEEPEILEFEDEDGREQALIDYNIQPGDHLHLISVPIAGGVTCISIPDVNPKRSIFESFKRSFSSKDQVFSSLFAPDYVKPGDNMMIQVYLFKESERNIVISEAIQVDGHVHEACYVPLGFDIKRGESVDVTLNIEGIPQINNKKTIVWRGRYTKCCFNVHIPKNCDSYNLYGEVMVSVNGKPYGELAFTTYLSNSSISRGTADIKCKKYDKIFISYAHQDSERVKHIALAYKAQGADYFFDRDKLKAGDVYEEKIFNYIDNADLFILCWSANAAQSDYVSKEMQRALARAYPQLSKKDATLKIYPVSIEPRAMYPELLRETYNFEEL